MIKYKIEIEEFEGGVSINAGNVLDPKVHATDRERLVAGVIDVAMRYASLAIMKAAEGGTMLETKNFETDLKPLIKPFLDQLKKGV